MSFFLFLPGHRGIVWAPLMGLTERMDVVVGLLGQDLTGRGVLQPGSYCHRVGRRGGLVGRRCFARRGGEAGGTKKVNGMAVLSLR